MAVLEAERIKAFAVVGTGTGMALAYSLGLKMPQQVSCVVGVNIYPSVRSRQDAMHFKSGMYRVGALASLYAPKTLRVLTGFVVAQSVRIRSAKQFLALSNSDAATESASSAQSYFEDYLKPNLDDILAGKGKGSTADCTYLAQDWAQVSRSDLSRPNTMILQHFDFPFVKPEFVESFAGEIGAQFRSVTKEFRQSHQDMGSLAKLISRHL